MEFFIPFSKDKQQEQKSYAGIKKFVSEQMGAKLSERRVFSLQYTHKGRQRRAEVGKDDLLQREPVIAILYDTSRGLYYVCTPNRGVLRGTPILVGKNEVESAVNFD